MSGVGITYLWVSKEFPPFVRLEGKRGDYEVYTPERTCRNIAEPDEMSDDPFTCSECGARGPFGDGIYHIGGCKEIDGRLVFWDSWPAYKFCPNCGARVIGTEAGE